MNADKFKSHDDLKPSIYDQPGMTYREDYGSPPCHASVSAEGQSAYCEADCGENHVGAVNRYQDQERDTATYLCEWAVRVRTAAGTLGAARPRRYYTTREENW